jgi:hypothetical protein
MVALLATLTGLFLLLLARFRIAALLLARFRIAALLLLARLRIAALLLIRTILILLILILIVLIVHCLLHGTATRYNNALRRITLLCRVGDTTGGPGRTL